MDARDLFTRFPLVRAGTPRPLRGGVLYELAHTPSYTDPLIIRATMPAGSGLELVQGAQGWALAELTDEQCAIGHWLRWRAPDAYLAVGPLNWELARAGFDELVEYPRNRLFASLLRRDGYDHARITDRDGRIVVFVVGGTPVQTLTFRADAVLVREGGRVRWREEAGWLWAVEPPATPLPTLGWDYR